MASILLLEGDPDVRRLLLILLADIGHTATVPADGEDAPAAVDLLLLDPASRIHLEYARRARDARPALPVVCMSFLKEEGRFLTTGGPLVHLQKPFTPDELDGAIALALV